MIRETTTPRRCPAVRRATGDGPVLSARARARASNQGDTQAECKRAAQGTPARCAGHSAHCSLPARGCAEATAGRCASPRRAARGGKVCAGHTHLERDAGGGHIEVGLVHELADGLDELLEQAALREASFEHCAAQTAAASGNRIPRRAPSASAELQLRRAARGAPGLMPAPGRSRSARRQAPPPFRAPLHRVPPTLGCSQNGGEGAAAVFMFLGGKPRHSREIDGLFFFSPHEPIHFARPSGHVDRAPWARVRGHPSRAPLRLASYTTPAGCTVSVAQAREPVRRGLAIEMASGENPHGPVRPRGANLWPHRPAASRLRARGGGLSTSCPQASATRPCDGTGRWAHVAPQDRAIHAHAYACMRACMHTRVYTHQRMHTIAHVRMHVNTHARMQPRHTRTGRLHRCTDALQGMVGDKHRGHRTEYTKKHGLRGRDRPGAAVSVPGRAGAGRGAHRTALAS